MKNKTFDLNIQYGGQMVHPGTGALLSNQVITFNFITWCIKKAYPDGVYGDVLEMWGVIQAKLESAVEQSQKNGDSTVELNEREVEFLLKNINTKVLFDTTTARYALTFVESVTKQLSQFD